MATIHKLTKDGATIFPATITDAVVHPQTGKTLTSMIKDYNVSELFPTEGIDGGNKYNLALAIQVLGTHLSAAQKTGGIKLTFISSVSPYPEEEYFLNKSSWSGNASDWDQRFEVGDVVADPSGSWTPGTAEQYIDQQVATVTSNLASETIARQTTDQSLQTQINAEAIIRANVDNTKADKATTLAGYGITNAYTKTEVNDLVDTPHQNYVTVQTYSALPASGSDDTIYRVSNYDGSVPEVNVTRYSEYAWNGSQYIFLCVKSQIDEVFDITVYHSNTTYSDLAAALGTDGDNIPPSLRRGGMSIKYVQSSDNKYVQYRLMSDTFNTTVTNWQGVDDEPTAGSDNLVKSGGVMNRIKDELWDLKTSYKTTDGVTYIIAAVDANGYIGFGLRSDGILKFFEEEIDFNSKLTTSTIIQGILSALDKQSEVTDLIKTDYANFAIVDKNGFVGMLLDAIGLHTNNIVSNGKIFDIIDKLGNIALELNKYGELTYCPSNAMIKKYQETFMPIPMIWTPNKCYILQGTTIRIFKSSIAPLHNPENYELRIERPSSMVSTDNFGSNYDFCYEYTINMSNPDFELKFGLYSDLPNKVYWDSHKVKFVHVAKKSSPISMKNVLCIGDSFTDAEYWPAELRRLLTGQISTYSDNRDIAPIGDNLINLNFIGTRDIGENRTPNEGISGWNYQKFVTESSSPFVFNGEVDFDKYLSERDVHGSVSDNIDKIDIAIIALNTNVGYNDMVCNAMYDALLAHNSQMKILVCGTTFATPYGMPTSIYYNQTYVSLSRSVKTSETFLQNKCAEDDYKNNLLYVDYHLQLDSFHNMRHTHIYPNSRNNNDYDKIMRGGDNVHPDNIGYFQMADALHAAFHYWCL